MSEKNIYSETSIIVLQEVLRAIIGTGDDDEDFYELGGTSMDAIMIESALLENGWLLSAADIMQNPEIQDMAKLMTPADDIDWEAEE